MKSKHIRNSRVIRQSIAVICAAAVWFTFNLGGSLQAAQQERSTGAVPAESGQAIGFDGLVGADLTIAGSMFNSTSSVTIAAVSLITISMLGFNLASSGKRGWGWMTLCVFASLIAILGKLGISMFLEISADNEIHDWDGD